MSKIIPFFLSFCLLSTSITSQNNPRVYLSGVQDSTIRYSQLFDSTIKIQLSDTSEIFHNSYKKTSGIVEIYFSGGALKHTIVQTKIIGSPLGAYSIIGLNQKLIPGSKVIVGGYLFKDPKTKKSVYFKESFYVVVKD